MRFQTRLALALDWTAASALVVGTCFWVRGIETPPVYVAIFLPIGFFVGLLTWGWR